MLVPSCFLFRAASDVLRTRFAESDNLMCAVEVYRALNILLCHGGRYSHTGVYSVQKAIV